MNSTPLPLLLCLFPACAPQTQSATHIGYGIYRLPKVPPGCEAHVIGKAPNLGKTTDWVAFFRANGLIFPKGGFAFMDPTTRTLIVCTTPEEFGLIEITGCH